MGGGLVSRPFNDREIAAMYANCPHCQLSIKVRQPWATPEHCPRCIARLRLATPMFQSPLPYRLLAANSRGQLEGALKVGEPGSSAAEPSDVQDVVGARGRLPVRLR